MADEKVNMGPEENKTPETQSPPGQGDLPPLEENNAPAVSGEDKAAPDHVEPDPPSADKHTQQTVLPGMGEDTPAPSGKVINLSDIQAADKGGKEASTTAPEKKAPEADQPKKRRGRPPKEQATVSAGKKEKAAEPRTGRPSKVDKAAREEAPPAVRDKVSRGKKADKGKETGSGGAPASKSAKAVKPGKAAPVKEAAVPPPEINLPPTPDVPPRPVEEGKIVYLKMAELHPFHTFREHPYKVQDDKAIVIDYDKPVDEEGEQYETYFFSVVDEADLLAAAEAAGVEQAVCSCSEKCEAGAVNTDCAVCSVNMSKCVGVEPEPEPTETEEPAPEEAEPETGGNMGMLLAVLAVALMGGGAAFYFKVLRPKQQKAAAPQEDYGDELTDYDEPDGYGDEDDDGPPWDEEDDDGPPWDEEDDDGEEADK